MDLFGVYGAGGCGRGIMPLLRERVAGKARLVFVNDAEGGEWINGHEVLHWRQFVAEPAKRRAVCLAVASSKVREKLHHKCVDEGASIIGVRASSVVEIDDVIVAQGALLSPFVILTSNIRIGRCFHANLYSYVEHDCRIGHYVTFGPAVRCNGNIETGDHVYFGSGAVLRQACPDKPLTIGAGAVIGMGAVVTKDFLAGVTVIGNPTRPIRY